MNCLSSVRYMRTLLATGALVAVMIISMPNRRSNVRCAKISMAMVVNVHFAMISDAPQAVLAKALELCRLSVAPKNLWLLGSIGFHFFIEI